MLISLIVILSLHGSFGYRHYSDRIPNGRTVPHPCVSGSLWEGVGHQNQAGGGDRNPFGRDFGLNKQTWDECLCKTDSDGDGRTNGEELGDPDCVWKVGDLPKLTDGLSHPGVCEPVDSAECMEKNTWGVECVEPGFYCAPLDSTEDRGNMTKKIAKVTIPASETTYMCQVVEFPQDKDYHIIGTEPDLDNDDLTHHIIIYGCPDQNSAQDAINKYSTPGQCTMYDHKCQTMMVLWTVGLYGTCFSSEYGIKVGPNGFQYGVIEVHYNNPELKYGLQDESGLLLHYTSKLRNNDAGRFFAAPQSVNLPPYQPSLIAEGGCPAECTDYMFDQPIYITEIVPHMHLTGRRMIVEHRRNHSTVEVLVAENNYDYDSPKPYSFDPAYKIEPGDEIFTRCDFDTTDKDVFTHYGFDTNDEMCFPLILYYPLQDRIRECFATNGVGNCGTFVGRDKAPDCFNDINSFFDGPYQAIAAELGQYCDPDGVVCLPGCEEAVNNARAHPCLQEGLDHIVLDRIQLYSIEPVNFIQMWVSCDYPPATKMAAKAALNEEVEGLSCNLPSSSMKLKPTMLFFYTIVYWLGVFVLMKKDRM